MSLVPLLVRVNLGNDLAEVAADLAPAGVEGLEDDRVARVDGQRRFGVAVERPVEGTAFDAKMVNGHVHAPLKQHYLCEIPVGRPARGRTQRTPGRSPLPRFHRRGGFPVQLLCLARMFP